MKIKPIWRASGISAFVLIIISGCDGSDKMPEQSMSPPRVTVTTLVTEQIVLNDVLPGRVNAIRTAEIRPQVGGVVRRRLFEQGVEVKAGQALFQINPAPFKADADVAAAILKRAESVMLHQRSHVARMKLLIRTGAVSQQAYEDRVSQLEQAVADVAQARAVLKRRQLDVKFSTVDAPVSGRIDQALATEGTLVTPNDSNAMARIQQIDQVYVDVRRPAAALESLRDALQQNQELSPSKNALSVDILRSTGERYPLSGHILFSGITVDPGTGDVLLRIVVENPARLLLPGMFVRAMVPRGNPISALLIPQQAVAHIKGQPQVWVVDTQNRVKPVVVQLGERVDRRYQILSGVTAGQRIVIEGRERLVDDAIVLSQEAALSEPLGHLPNDEQRKS
ncbi:MAG: efflux RND transporter periplasmic adaptor subunit [Rouxiella aceris]|uniref:efflux RND transporter periplasmic adaptor subunit n=1 Tax=Rouxiella aceris TaxID=2703884 RepID=UPI00284B2A32|nr:efflux RND transporter periplasmic adaptor subunit [Rouxiella aceris]MDR3434313.1 efflux RND transporter periplasmic adaptor subunit [Rouxiella aceris]